MKRHKGINKKMVLGLWITSIQTRFFFEHSIFSHTQKKYRYPLKIESK